MNDMHFVALALFLGLTGMAGALVFLATRLKGGINITVQTPPITVQAPHALLPDSVQMTLDAINAKLTQAKQPASEVEVAGLIYEGVALAEQSKLKGKDRFFIARDFVNSRASARNLEVDARDVALRIEAAVAVSKRKP